MKKFYSMLAMAVVVASASAAPKAVTTLSSVKDAQVSTTVEGALNIAAPVQFKKQGPAKKVSTNKDLAGAYSWSFFGCLANELQGAQTLEASLEVGDEANQILFTNMPYSDAIWYGIIDFDKQTITLKEQNLGIKVKDADGTETDLLFTPGRMISGNQWEKINEMVGTISEDGTITFDEDDTFSLVPATGRGYLQLFAMNVLRLPDYFKYNASEWESLGTAKYMDGYFNTLSGVDVPEYEVEVQRNKQNGDRYCVVNPYKNNWTGLNVGNGDGYLVFDASNPECVLVEMLVESGMVTDDSENHDMSVLTSYYLYNKESYNVNMQGYTVEDVIDEFGLVGQDISCVDGDDVTIYNGLFGISGSPLSPYKWTGGDMLPTNITMPQGWLSGVEEIITDENAPVKLYNLQGMEVVNPEVGTIVIEKKGNKTVKRIVK